MSNVDKGKLKHGCRKVEKLRLTVFTHLMDVLTMRDVCLKEFLNFLVQHEISKICNYA